VRVGAGGLRVEPTASGVEGPQAAAEGTKLVPVYAEGNFAPAPQSGSHELPGATEQGAVGESVGQAGTEPLVPKGINPGAPASEPTVESGTSGAGPEAADAVTVLADLQARYLERKEFTEDWNKFWHARWEGASVRVVDGSPGGDLFYAGADYAPIIGDRSGLGYPVEGLLFFNKAAARELASRSDVDRRRLTETLAQLQYRGSDTGARGSGENPFRSRLTADRRKPLSDDEFLKLLTDIGLSAQSQ
jgi:hypothetical protein